MRKPSVQESARAQADLYRGACNTMSWGKYCAAIDAFMFTSPLKRPCHTYADRGLKEESFMFNLAVSRGIVFG